MLIFLSAIKSPDDSVLFETIYKNYRDLMFHVASRILGDTRDSEDVVHDAFVGIIDCIDRLPRTPGPKMRAFAVAVTESRAIDLYRRRKRISFTNYDEAIGMPAFASPIDSALEGSAVAKAIASLPAEYRDVLLLRFDMDIPVKKLAPLLGKKEDAVYKLINRARERLAKELEKEGIEI